MSDPASLPPDYFERLYRADPDPWRFASSDYERAKYAHTLAALPRNRFAAGFEVGCSIGVLTAQLSTCCDRLLAVDVSETVLAQARRRNDATHVEIARMRIPGEWPDSRFDLILFSEVLYYLAPADLARTAEQTLAALGPDAVVLLVHYTDPTDYPLTGDDAADHFIRGCESRLRPDLQERRPQYRLDRLIPR